MDESSLKVVGLTGSGKKQTNWKIFGAVLGVIILSLGILAGILLVRQQQDLREKAAQGTSRKCPEAEQCPMRLDARHLLNCHPPEADNSASDSVCNIAGRVEFCGTKNYCCPTAGGKWTDDMSACSVSSSSSPSSRLPLGNVQYPNTS